MAVTKDPTIQIKKGGKEEERMTDYLPWLTLSEGSVPDFLTHVLEQNTMVVASAVLLYVAKGILHDRQEVDRRGYRKWSEKDRVPGPCFCLPTSSKGPAFCFPPLPDGCCSRIIHQRFNPFSRSGTSDLMVFGN